MRVLSTVLTVSGATAAVMLAPVATASPTCTNTGPTTTLCQSPGHSQIVTSPPVSDNGFYDDFPYFGGGVFIIGLPF